MAQTSQAGSVMLLRQSDSIWTLIFITTHTKTAGVVCWSPPAPIDSESLACTGYPASNLTRIGRV
jgi:hypothetical protein